MTLLMRDQENIEKGIEKGMEKGIKKGIHGAVAICRDLGMSNEEISRRLQKQFELSREEAEGYLKAEV